jgi:cobalt/nickel transport system permease protein
MHIPDGMLSTPTWTASWLGAAGFLGFAVRDVRRRMTDARIVLMAVFAALIFALQMLNFPVAGGTSGHFAGGAAAAIVLGPWPAVVIMSTVLLIQSLIFADGGITALGANIVNLGVIGPFVGWAAYAGLSRLRDRRTWRAASAFVAAWSATLIAALGAALMVWVSGGAPFGLVVSSMSFWHALIGIGEGLITAGLVAYLLAVRPDLLEQGEARSSVGGVAVVFGLMAVVAAGLSFLASGSPDGLESVGERLGFLSETDAVFGSSPIPDYLVPGVDNEALAGVLAGVVGIIVTGALLYGAFGALRRRPGG